jgi:hypothetical protein
MEAAEISERIFDVAIRERRRRSRLIFALTGVIGLLSVGLAFFGYFSENIKYQDTKLGYQILQIVLLNLLTPMFTAAIGYYFGSSIAEKRVHAETGVTEETIDLYVDLVRSKEISLELQRKILELEKVIARANQQQTPP